MGPNSNKVSNGTSAHHLSSSSRTSSSQNAGGPGPGYQNTGEDGEESISGMLNNFSKALGEYLALFICF